MTVSKLGDYRIIKELGRGGMGVVYLAEHQRLLKKYALKILPQAFSEDPQLVERFHNEARVMADLNHPNIVKVVNMSYEETTYYLVMEYVESETGAPKSLHQFMREHGGRIPENRAERIVLDILSALETAHEREIIHRDIKPANILLDKDGTAKVADFGLVKILGGDDRTATKRVALTAEGIVIGTYDFMSPEQKAGQPVDLRTDIYAVGVIIYSILTGRKPEGRFSHASEIVQGLSTKWDAIVDKCLQTLPEDRFQNASEVIQAIKAKKAPKRAKAKKAPKEKKTHSGFLGELLKYGTIIIVVVIVVSAIMSYVMLKDKDFREMLMSTVETAIKEKDSGKDAAQTQTLTQKKGTYPRKSSRQKPERQITIKSPQTESEKEPQTRAPIITPSIPGLEIMGGPEFANALKEVAAFLEDEEFTIESLKQSEYYKNASPEEKMILDLLLGFYSESTQDYSRRPAEGLKDFTQFMTREGLHDEGPLRESWDNAMKKLEEGRKYREQGDMENAQKSFAEAQREMKRISMLQAAQRQVDGAKMGMEKSMAELEESQPGIQDNLLFQTAERTGENAGDAQEEGDYQRAKILYSLAGKILGRTTQGQEPAECVEILQRLVEFSKSESDKVDASRLEKSLYTRASRKEQEANSELQNKNYSDAADAFVESAYLYERAKERILRGRISQRSDRSIP
jgi:serine/threonine protein kinase